MLAYLFVLIVVVLRFVLAPLAFAPVGAALLFFGARMPRKQAWIPLALLVATDVLLSMAVYGYPLTADLAVSWLWYAGVLLLGGGVLRTSAAPLRLVGTAVGSSVAFFLMSNFASWLVWEMYPKTLAGLAASYVAGIPFFRNQLASDVIFTAVAFSIPAVIEALKPRRDVAAA